MMFDWKVSTLGKVCNKRNEQVQPDNFSDVYVGLEHVESGNPKLTTFGDPATVRSAKSKFYPSDVLYGKLRPYLDKAALAEVEGMCSTDILVLSADKELTAPEYLVFLVHTKPFIDHAMKTTSGVNHPRTSWNSISQFAFTLPALSEQRTIASVLTKIQEAITVQQEIIDRTRELKKELMTMLFTKGLRGEQTKETEIGLVPESWEVKPMINAVEIEYGIQAAVAHNLDSSIGTPILTNVNISFEGELRLDKIRYYPITGKNKNKILKKNDILFNWRSGSQEHVGKTAIFDLEGEYTFSSFILRLSTRDKFIPHFVFYYLTWLREDGFFVRKHQYSINAKFNASEAARTPIVCPSIKEQNEIADILSVTVGKLKIEESKMNHLQDLFKTVLHELMTGSIRTTPLMEA